MNIVGLMGRIGNELELRSAGDSFVLNFTLAVGDDYNKDRTHWIDCVAWDKKAEFIKTHMYKGMRIAVSGRLETDTWEDKSGNKRKTTRVVIAQADFADSKKTDTQPEPKEIERGFKPVDDGDDELPF